MVKKVCCGLLAVLAAGVIVSQIVLAIQADGSTEVSGEFVFPETELAYLQDVSASYKEGQGILSLSCTGMGGGGVYVYLNGVVKLNLTTSDPQNIKVKRGDVLLVKGHGLNGEATVVISSMAGGLDSNVLNKSVKVGNLAKHLITIL